MKTILFSLLFFTAVALAQPLTQHFRIEYENGPTYEIRLTDSTISWRDWPNGQFETDLVKKNYLTPQTEILQWQELDGSFVTLAIDRPKKLVVSSGIFNGESWLLTGKIQ